MAKGVGLDAGEYEVKLVELDGSYKKPKLAKVHVEPVPEGSSNAVDESHAIREAEVTLRALESSGVAADHLNLSFPCRESVLRLLTVPFVGEDRIRKVIKFEAESFIHSHNVDDMVVDFYTVAEAAAETKVLVAAVPKPALRTTLHALERAGVEPLGVDLDTMALFRVAEWCGAFEPDEPSGSDDDASLVASPPCRLVLDLGARSTRILVVVNGRLVDMRALRTGADSVAEEVASRAGITLVEARQAVAQAMASDEEFLYIVEDAAALEDEALDADEANGDGLAPLGQADAEPVGEPVRISQRDVTSAVDRALMRLKRELVRFSTSVPALTNVEAVWVTGGASQVPGMSELLQEVFDARPQELDVLGGIAHKLDDDEVAELNPKLAVAVGLALSRIGGPGGFNFRQEDLVFTKGFDRIKFPLAIACMLALFLVLVLALRSHRKLTNLERQYGQVYQVVPIERRGKVVGQKATFYGYVGRLVNEGHWFASDKRFDSKEYKKLIDKLLRTDCFKRLGVVKSAIKKYELDIQKKQGYFKDLRLGSGLGAIVELSEVLRRIETQLGRYLLTQLDLKLPAKKEGRYLSFTVVLRSDEISSFRKKGSDLEEAIRAAAKSPDSAFAGINDRQTGEKQTFSEGSEGYILNVRIDLKSEDDYPVFPKGQA